MKEVTKSYSIQSYIDKNRDKLDESLVSLRVMKEVDRFLDYQKLSNKDLATELGYSESYISQLMSGVKNVNTSFINKFEKQFSVRLDFRIYLKTEDAFLHKIEMEGQFKLNVSFNIFILHDEYSRFSFKQNSKATLNVTDADYGIL